MCIMFNDGHVVGCECVVMSFVVMVCDINMVCMVPGLCLALL